MPQSRYHNGQRHLLHMQLTMHELLLYYLYNTLEKQVKRMYIKIDFESGEALYMQLRNQIVIGIARRELREGDSLPSVRQMAEEIGINMHTVNKAYSVLKQEGLIRLDRGRGAVISFDINRIQAIEEVKESLRLVLAKACCKNISREEIHELIEEIYNEY